MKISVSVRAEDLATMDEFARATGLRSRSAVVQHAISLLATPDLEDDYAAAWAEWADSGDAALWESVAADGVADATR
jgi:hypothetical protein